jgi:hypothetical protein
MSRTSEALDPGAYNGLPGHKEPTTSRDAAVAMAGRAAILRERVFRAIQAAGPEGLTADEAARTLGETVLAVRPRVSELRSARRVAPSGHRRPNASGMKAAAWKVTP